MTGRPIVLAAVAWLTGSVVASAHLDFGARTRVDLSNDGAVVTLWIDATHVASGILLDMVPPKVAAATRVTSHDRACAPGDAALTVASRTTWVVTVPFACPGRADRAILGASSALGLGSLQYVEVRDENGASGTVRPARTTIDLAAMRGADAPWPLVVGLMAVLGAIAVIWRRRARSVGTAPTLGAHPARPVPRPPVGGNGPMIGRRTTPPSGTSASSVPRDPTPPTGHGKSRNGRPCPNALEGRPL